MTELNSCSINNNLKSTKYRSKYVPSLNDTVEGSGQLQELVHYPRLNSKIILQNMEEVLDTVKKQHKEKHRRKKELKKLAMIEAANGSEVFQSEVKKNCHSERKHKHRYKEKRLSKNKPLKDEYEAENGKVSHDSQIKTGTILEHFPRTPKKEEHTIQDCEKEEDESENIEKVLGSPKSSKVTNAFEILMNARNKSIGSNTPGKDSPSPLVDKEVAATNAERKLKLQEWADQKGGAKRRLEEEARAAYVEEQLEQRAKRFKQMLVSGATSPSNSKVETKERSEKAKLLEKGNKKNKQKKEKVSRARRLSSVDSLEQCTPTKLDAETAEFFEKLNSPTKKRDSLLGYFPKKDSQKELATRQSVIKTKEHTKVTKPGKSVLRSHKLQENVEAEVSTTVQYSRPRRSCAGKSRYDYDLDMSPTKTEKLSKTSIGRKNATRKINTSEQIVVQEQDCTDIIVLDDSTNMSDTNIFLGTPKKLAPLFVRSLTKPSPDPEIIKARKAFLQSGVPEKLRLEQEKQKQYEQNFEEATEIFPKISHVKQLSKNELEFDKEILKCSKELRCLENNPLSPSSTRKAKSRSNKRYWIVGSLSDCVMNDFQIIKSKDEKFSLDLITLPIIGNKRSIIKNWKTEFDRFPTYKCYNQMREKYRYFSAIDSAQDTEQVSESFVVTRQIRRCLEAEKKKETNNSDEEYKPPATAPNGELLFSEKYKPLLFEQVLVNLNPVTQLKEFLSNWSNGAGGSTKNSQIPDNLMDLNDSSCSNQGSSINTVVLLGPVSSGKTNAVFALANEMNFNVLEINAGMKRTGKRLIQELQEATQSHQIRKDVSSSASSQKALLRMSLNGLKAKHKFQNSNSNQFDSQSIDSNSSDLQQSSRKCLILIEDADIVFEQTDAGFTDAIYSLAASSKRPVIIVASNPNCAHLQRLISQNTIHFSSPNVLNISKFLAVLSLIENCPIHLDDLVSLYLFNRRDLRKTLLELQFFIQSGGDRHIIKKELVGDNKGKANYFASPRKRQFSVEQQESEVADNTTSTDKNIASGKSSDQVYMHRSLFEYYTVGQNYKFRIPFPIDFHLLNANLNEIFQVSQKLKDHKTCENITQSATTRRKSKSPKKQWLTTVRANSKTSLDNLCSFYENLSIAALMNEQESIIHSQDKQMSSIIDRLKPNIAETISHCLLEKTIEVNLGAELYPYNLFDTHKDSVSLCDEFVATQMRSKRARYLDYEPSLRSICRSEKIRSTFERRSTRFYHYLRNYSINVCNFSTTHFEQACEAFQIPNTAENPAT